MQITHFDDNVKGVVFRNRYHCHDIHDTSWINYAENNEKGKGFYETKDINFFLYTSGGVSPSKYFGASYTNGRHVFLSWRYYHVSTIIVFPLL